MYDWLRDALQDGGTVVTANRRLARELSEVFARAQVAAGETAWQSPEVFASQDWLQSLFDKAYQQDVLPARINLQQSQLLWEQCFLKAGVAAEIGTPAIARMARDSWQRLADWQISISDIARTAQSDDQKIFATVAGHYLSQLEQGSQVDDAGLGELVQQLIATAAVPLPAKLTLAGFERPSPRLVGICDRLRAAGTTVVFAPAAEGGGNCTLRVFANDAEEYRAAGHWAGQLLRQNPLSRIAIIAQGLDVDGDAIARHVREGATPGWQYGHHSLYEALDVSYGRRLAGYPAIAIALSLLAWLVRDLSSTDVGMLLRSPLLGRAGVAGRSRLDLHLRNLPDRRWSPSMLTAELRGKDDSDDAADWLGRLAALSKRRHEIPRALSPAAWVELLDEVLQAFGWPGETPLGSEAFQLVNRWRELCNEFARLAAITPRMSLATALLKLESMAGEVVFQPQARNAGIQLMGPLEASGMQFDAVWVTGVTSSNWPRPAYPLALVSKRLQREHEMPDASPQDTYDFARQVLSGLLAAADTVVCSYPLTVNDAEQTVSDLLDLAQCAQAPEDPAPPRHAAQLRAHAALVPVDDEVPPVSADETIAGGAATVQRQISDPITAFVHGRMHAREIYPQAVGIPPPMRGNLIHDALYRLYLDLPSSEAIRGWQGDELTTRIESALDLACKRYLRNADDVLHQLLRLERQRIGGLLRAFVAADGHRGDFKVSGVEGQFEFVAGRVRLPLRFDRIDTLAGKGIAILDYKTGKPKQLLNRSGEVQDVQLFVYAAASDAPVSALALVNVDSREIRFDGAGAGYTDENAWPELLQDVAAQIATACAELENGDVRINIEQSAKAARPLNLLSRFTELRHDRG